MLALFEIGRILLFAAMLMRSIGLVLTSPVLGEQSVPRKVRALFAVALAFLLTTIAAPLTVTPDSLLALTLLLGAEMTVGLALGFVARLMLLAFELAGQIVALQMGLGMAQVLDPLTKASTNVVARWMGLVAMALFLTLNGHHHLLRALAGSLTLVPPGTGLLSGAVVESLVQFSGESLAAAMRIAAPAIGVLLLTSMGLGILARTVPQMNVFIVGFPLKIGVGIAAVLFSLPYMLEVARREVGELANRLASLVLAA